MKNFSNIKNKYLSLGVKEDNIDYALGAVLDGTKREYILESLTAGDRGMSEQQSTELLEALFEENGGEFKKENRGGYLFGTLLLMIGLLGAGFLIAMIITREFRIKFLVLAGSAAFFGLVKGSSLLIKSFRGNYRDTDAPFENA